MSPTVYIKSGLRHVFDVWSAHRGYPIFNPKTGDPVDIEDAICAILYNFHGYLLELLHERMRSNTYDVEIPESATQIAESASEGWEVTSESTGKTPETWDSKNPPPTVVKGPLALDESYLRPEGNGNIKRGTE